MQNSYLIIKLSNWNGGSRLESAEIINIRPVLLKILHQQQSFFLLLLESSREAVVEGQRYSTERDVEEEMLRHRTPCVDLKAHLLIPSIIVLSMFFNDFILILNRLSNLDLPVVDRSLWKQTSTMGNKKKTFLHEAEDKLQDFLSAVHSWLIYSSLQRSAFVRDSNYGWLVHKGSSC